jgi:hypothetical protein
MKKILLIGLVMFFMTVGLAYAGSPKDNCGCGWGTMLFKDNDGLVQQVFAATTNGSFGNQTFGISSGTAECKQATSFASNEPLNRFVADNMDNLARDIAMGQGEYLDTLAALMEVPMEERDEFSVTLQANFPDIFPAESITHVEVIENIARVAQRG